MSAENQQIPPLAQTVAALSDLDTLPQMFHHGTSDSKLPSAPVLQQIIDLTRSVIFPGYYGRSAIDPDTVAYHMGTRLERLTGLLTGQIESGLCFACDDAPRAKGGATGCDLCRERARRLAMTLVSRLPELRRVLATDVEAAYLGDPAAQSRGEVIACYPAIKALTCYRLAHELHTLGVPLIPRIITEMAHSETGIDIHPAATIGTHFTIDHGTGVVIGATCIIGNHVKIYQGVTLGARSFPLDEGGNPIKNNPRHPIIEDNVIIYSNATILGRVTIGANSVIGANAWLTASLPPNSKATLPA